MAVRTEEITSIHSQQIQGFDQAVRPENVGQVVQVGDGIARVWGLSKAMAGELLHFPRTDVMGLALNLEEEVVGVVILGPFTAIEEGDEVTTTGRIAQVPVGDAMIGRVVDALGNPLD